MRNDKEINAELKKLCLMAADVGRYNADTRKQIAAQIEVLTGRMTEKQVESKWYVDEGDLDYRDGDNDLYHELDRTVAWIEGKKGYEAPSSDS